MISEGSYDTEDWSNGAEISSFANTEINYILKSITLRKSYFKSCYYFAVLLFLLYFLSQVY